MGGHPQGSCHRKIRRRDRAIEANELSEIQLNVLKDVQQESEANQHRQTSYHLRGIGLATDGGATMKVLITGMSGTGKSSTIAALAASGYRAIDLDEDGWSGWEPCGGDPTGANPGHDWLWDEARLERLLDDEEVAPLFVAGCAPNMGRFVPRFDRIVLLRAPTDILLDRVRTRTGNDYGKASHEAQRIVENTREVEPLLRRIATHELDTARPIGDVLRAVLRISGQSNGTPLRDQLEA